MLTGGEVAALLAKGRFDLTSEANCHDDMELYLGAYLPLGCTLSREYRLTPESRLDFLVDDRIAVEIKVAGAQPLAILRQLKRYAEHPQIEGLVLATGKAVALPAIIEGKPLHLVNMGGAWL